MTNLITLEPLAKVTFREFGDVIARDPLACYETNGGEALRRQANGVAPRLIFKPELFVHGGGRGRVHTERRLLGLQLGDILLPGGGRIEG